MDDLQQDEEFNNKYVNNGEAFFTKDLLNVESFIKTHIIFLVPIFVDIWVNNFARHLASRYNKEEPSGIVFKTDLSISISRRLPEIIIKAYEKILHDFEQKLKTISSKKSEV